MERPDHGKPGNALDRRQVLRGIAAAGAVVGAGGLLGACSSSSSSGQAAASPTSTVKRRGGALKVGLTGGSGTDTLDPHKGLTYLDTARAQSLYQPLLQLNTAAQTEFVLAEDISPHGSTSNWGGTPPLAPRTGRRSPGRSERPRPGRLGWNCRSG